MRFFREWFGGRSSEYVLLPDGDTESLHGQPQSVIHVTQPFLTQDLLQLIFSFSDLITICKVQPVSRLWKNAIEALEKDPKCARALGLNSQRSASDLDLCIDQLSHVRDLYRLYRAIIVEKETNYLPLLKLPGKKCINLMECRGYGGLVDMLYLNSNQFISRFLRPIATRAARDSNDRVVIYFCSELMLLIDDAAQFNQKIKKAFCYGLIMFLTIVISTPFVVYGMRYHQFPLMADLFDADRLPLENNSTLKNCADLLIRANDTTLVSNSSNCTATYAQFAVACAKFFQEKLCKGFARSDGHIYLDGNDLYPVNDCAYAAWKCDVSLWWALSLLLACFLDVSLIAAVAIVGRLGRDLFYQWIEKMRSDAITIKDPEGFRHALEYGFFLPSSNERDERSESSSEDGVAVRIA